MALQIELKPGERIFIGASLITNVQERIRLYVDGDAPILRERDVLIFTAANSPAKRVYFAVQLMYFADSIDQAQEEYLDLVGGLVEASPSSTPYVTRISCHLFSGNIYRALKEARLLIDYEESTLDSSITAPNRQTRSIYART